MTQKVVLDANVLIPVRLADLLLRLGELGLIYPHWSPTVLDSCYERVPGAQNLGYGWVNYAIRGLARYRWGLGFYGSRW